MAIQINGKETAALIRAELAEQVRNSPIQPGLAVILVGNDPASAVYVRNKKKACEEIGFYSESYVLPEQTTQKELLDLIAILNTNPKIHGILVQLPLPKHLDEEAVIAAISPDKDVDAFHMQNVGKIMLGNYRILPCTPAGVMELLRRYNVDVTGKECVVLGRSNIVGKPMAMLLLQANGTVTICHSKTKDLKEICRRADILVVAIGKPEFVRGDMIKEGAVVIDVGINRRLDGTLCGDVCYQEAEQIASMITPVPGGVGPMTIAMLMKNTWTAANNS